MELLIKLLADNALLPSRANEYDAGLDLYSIETITIQPGEYRLVKTGISIQLPRQTEAQIRPRSGLALKHGITVLNSPGTIDEGYRGEIGVILINHGNKPFVVEEHMKIAQMVIKPVVSVDLKAVPKLDDSERGTGGFGSSGLK